MIVQNRFPGCIAMVETARALGMQQKIFVDEVHQLIQFPRVVDTEWPKFRRRESLTSTASTPTPSPHSPGCLQVGSIGWQAEAILSGPPRACQLDRASPRTNARPRKPIRARRVRARVVGTRLF